MSEQREANGFPGRAADYLPSNPAPRGGIRYTPRETFGDQHTKHRYEVTVTAWIGAVPEVRTFRTRPFARRHALYAYDRGFVVRLYDSRSGKHLRLF